MRGCGGGGRGRGSRETQLSSGYLQVAKDGREEIHPERFQAVAVPGAESEPGLRARAGSCLSSPLPSGLSPGAVASFRPLPSAALVLRLPEVTPQRVGALLPGQPMPWRVPRPVRVVVVTALEEARWRRPARGSRECATYKAAPAAPAEAGRARGKPAARRCERSPTLLSGQLRARGSRGSGGADSSRGRTRWAAEEGPASCGWPLRARIPGSRA